jgi:hypothetical protein
MRTRLNPKMSEVEVHRACRLVEASKLTTGSFEAVSLEVEHDVGSELFHQRILAPVVRPLRGHSRTLAQATVPRGGVIATRVHVAARG